MDEHSTDETSRGRDEHACAEDGAELDGEHFSATSTDVYDWYTRGLRLLESGSAAAAEQVLHRAAQAAPGSRSILEALGRAQFQSRRYRAARESFERIVDANPTDDYAQFGMGLAAARAGDLLTAVEHLALAAAMRPDIAHYRQELHRARARLEAAR
ncbi:MAG: tetratricopeptide repeat protein [Acidothermus cellulolyticus]|nr:tetratricopeptide repeat protein [Acidothermus cellulolyticus]